MSKTTVTLIAFLTMTMTFHNTVCSTCLACCVVSIKFIICLRWPGKNLKVPTDSKSCFKATVTFAYILLT